MRFGTLFTALGSLAYFAVAQEESATVQVDVYEGKECDDENKVKAGDFVSVHYTGTIAESSATGEKGKQFDSSRDFGEPFQFHVGLGNVIQGWDEGFVGLCKGAKAKLTIPPEFGYGENGAGADIPGGATLAFDVEVVDITEEEIPNVFAEIDTDGDGKITREEVITWFKEAQGHDITEQLDEIFEMEDTNKDGVITWDEFSGPKGPEEAAETTSGDEL